MPGVSGVLPAAAAGIAFAADVSAGIKLGVSAFDYDKSNDSVKALTLKHHNADYESPISFSISGEKAGATYHLCEGKISTVQFPVAKASNNAVNIEPRQNRFFCV